MRQTPYQETYSIAEALWIFGLKAVHELKMLQATRQERRERTKGTAPSARPNGLAHVEPWATGARLRLLSPASGLTPIALRSTELKLPPAAAHRAPGGEHSTRKSRPARKGGGLAALDYLGRAGRDQAQSAGEGETLPGAKP